MWGRMDTQYDDGFFKKNPTKQTIICACKMKQSKKINVENVGKL